MAILAIWALLLTAPSPAAAPVSSGVTVSAPGVTVKLGSASLEEYQQGNPANRVQLMRGN